MNSGLYIGATGLKSMSQGLNVISNNLANVNTYGFKQQNLQYSDLISTAFGHLGEEWETETGSKGCFSQVGHGVSVGSVRTFFEQSGGIQGTNTTTDLAISGKGFFQVQDDSGATFYTRTGDFISDNAGYIRTPMGMSLMGWQCDERGNVTSNLAPIQIDTFATIPALATSQVQMTMNLGFSNNAVNDEANPYFSLLQQYDGTMYPPMPGNSAGWQQNIVAYDASGNRKELTAWFDNAPSGNNGERVMEFVIADTSQVWDNPGDGALMSGVLVFNAAGEIQSMSAFTPNVAGSTDLADWTPAQFDGNSFVLNMNGQDISFSFGTTGGTVQAGAATAAEVGADLYNLGGVNELGYTLNTTTAFAGKSMTEYLNQDGYAEGIMSHYNIGTDGMITASYSNGVNKDIWQIPLCRFTSNDGLYRAGNNLYQATQDVGNITLGVAGDENFGDIISYSLEISNVDIATELVNMIVTQRGFQSNTKVVTTTDEMLRKAMEIKRS